MCCNKLNLKGQKGQSLVEVLVVLLITAVMLVSLIMVILSSLKNAQFAQNQTRATNFAQDTIDKIRILRDGNHYGTLQGYNPPSVPSVPSVPSGCFIGLWISSYCSPGPCYYKLVSDGSSLNQALAASPKESLGDGFYRQISISSPTGSEVKLIVQVSWTDSSGEHNSNLETVLIKPSYDCIP